MMKLLQILLNKEEMSFLDLKFTNKIFILELKKKLSDNAKTRKSNNSNIRSFGRFDKTQIGSVAL